MAMEIVASLTCFLLVVVGCAGRQPLPTARTLIRRVRKVAHYSRDEAISRLARIGANEAARARLARLVRARPSDIFRWADLARACDLDTRSHALIVEHRLNRANTYLLGAAPYIEELARAHLEHLASTSDLPAVVAEAITEIIKWKNVVRCREDHAGGGGYFTAAEPVMRWQWDNVIWPIICDCDFTATLDLGCGHGRNTELLRHLARSIDLVDVNASCLAACRHRFGSAKDTCEFRYHLTPGDGLPSIASGTITMVYSWDTMVHFDQTIMRDYLRETTRVLAPGGKAFMHYSNVGAERPNSDLATNHGMRGDMSGELFAQFAAENDLTILSHRLSGRADKWAIDNLDCLTLVVK